MSPAGSLEDLEALDRTLLHVFVAGPGHGEGIAVALPGAGWILVDGCTTGHGNRGRPLESIVSRWRASAGDPLVAMVLTHPHEDHVGGFAELIDALAPQYIGVADPTDDIRKRLRRPGIARSEIIRAKATLKVLDAISRWEESEPAREVLRLHDGVEVPAAPSTARIVARSPNLAMAAQSGSQGRNPNSFSVVLEIIHGSSRVVLTSDLPRYVTGTSSSVATGWDFVMASHGFLGSHVVLKIPHHGSAEAIHPDLMSPSSAGRERAWCITPYCRSNLPRVAELDALPWMLKQEPAVLLTAVPIAKDLQASEEHPGIVHLPQLVSRMSSRRTGAAYVDSAGVHVAPGGTCEPLDPIWCMAVDEGGLLAGRWRGRVALEVIP